MTRDLIGRLAGSHPAVDLDPFDMLAGPALSRHVTPHYPLHASLRP
jgi:hypothetical protein